MSAKIDEVLNNDAVLVALWKSGKKSAFDQLFSRYRSRLLRHTERILSSRADAEDVVQEAFLKAFRGIGSFKEQSSFFTWIFRITLNCAFSVRRTSNWSGRLTSISGHSDDDWNRPEVSLHDSDDPADEYEKQQVLKALDKQLNCMSGIFAETFMLREVYGLSYNQIGQVMHCSVGTVRSRLFRARQLIEITLTDS